MKVTSVSVGFISDYRERPYLIVWLATSSSGFKRWFLGDAY